MRQYWERNGRQVYNQKDANANKTLFASYDVGVLYKMAAGHDSRADNPVSYTHLTLPTILRV